MGSLDVEGDIERSWKYSAAPKAVFLNLFGPAAP